MSEATEVAFTPITTQEELNSVIKDRLERERSKFEGYETYKQKAKEFDSLKKTSDGFEQTIAQLNKLIDGDEKTPGYKKQIETLQAQVKKYESDSVKTRIALESGLPYALAQKLSGDTEDAIRQDAKNLAGYLKGPQVAPAASNDPPEFTDKAKAAVKRMVANISTN